MNLISNVLIFNTKFLSYDRMNLIDVGDVLLLVVDFAVSGKRCVSFFYVTARQKKLST